MLKPLEDLEAELGRTSVISQRFRSTILAYAGKIAEVAYKNGYEAAKEISARYEGARFKVIIGDEKWTTYLKEFPQDDGKDGSFPMYAQGWDPEDPGRGETRILMTRAEAETVEAL